MVEQPATRAAHLRNPLLLHGNRPHMTLRETWGVFMQAIHQGHCLCGAVKYRSDAQVLWAGHCHCDSCRRANSALIVSFFGVPRDSVTWTGDIRVYASSHNVQRGFCGTCGAQMYYHTDIWPDETHLFAATLDDPHQFEPRAHYHYAEKVPCLSVTDDLPKHAHSEDVSEQKIP